MCSLGNARLGYIPVALFLIVAIAITCTVDLERGESTRVRSELTGAAQEYTKHSRARQFPRRPKGRRMTALRKSKSIIRCSFKRSTKGMSRKSELLPSNKSFIEKLAHLFPLIKYNAVKSSSKHINLLG